MGFSDDVCDGTPFGPWWSGALSLCFVDFVLFGLHSGLFLVIGIVRLIQTIGRPKVYRDASIAYKGKMLFMSVIVLMSIVQLIVRLGLERALAYEVAADAMVSVAWLLCLVVVVMEESKGMVHPLALKLWWVAGFMISAAKLQTYATRIDQRGRLEWYYATFIVQLIAMGLVCILGLFFRQTEDKFKLYAQLPAEEAEAALRASEGGASYGTLFATDDDGGGGGADADDDAFVTTPGAGVGGPRRQSPEANAGILSRLTFWWCGDLLALGWQRALEFTDLWPLMPADSADTVSRTFERNWRQEQAGEQPSLARAIRKTFGWTFCAAGLAKAANDALVFTGPILLQLIIQFISDDDAPMSRGLGLAAAMFVTGVATTLFIQNYFFHVFRVGQRVRAAIVTTVYRKAFLISTTGRQDFTTGEVVNHMSIDAKRLMDLTPYLHMVWSAPVQIIVSITLLFRLVGVAVFAGVAFMVIMVPVNIMLVKKLMRYQKAMMTHKDKRVKIMNEVLQGIRVIKFFAWEQPYLDRVNEIRDEELRTLRSSAYLRALTFFSWATTPVMVALVTFGTFAATGKDLTAEIAFTSLALFNVLRFPLNMLPNVISSLVEANISVKRIQGFLLSEERDRHAVQWNPQRSSSELALSVDQGTFSWDAAKPVVRQLSLSVPHGRLTAIVGTVGCGKTSLLRSLLGDLVKLGGTVKINGTLAYASQAAWIQNATVRDNILFGKPFDAARYDLACSSCELKSDLDMLPAGDQTEIGEKGINLSGGQKQRVSLARAVYQDSDIYLLDDPLSAVDVHVGRNIFDHCFAGVLGAKTRLFVTHQLQYLPECDYIVVMKDGSIEEEGTYEELLSRPNGELAYLIREFTNQGKDMGEEGGEGDEEVLSIGELPTAEQLRKLSMDGMKLSVVTGDKEESAGDKGVDRGAPTKTTSTTKTASIGAAKLVEKEEREVGSLDSRVLVDYVRALGGPLIAVAVMTLFTMEIATRCGSDYWLNIWSNDELLEEHPLGYYLGVYAGWAAANAALVLTRGFTVALGGIAAARVLHENVLARVIRAPTSFFDTTPTGRILNRFSKDVYGVDEVIPRILSMFLLMCFWSLGVIVIISTVTPFFLAFLFPLGILYQRVQQYYIRSSRELKRLDSISGSPIYNHFSETLNGVSTIRSYDANQRFVEENEARLDRNQQAYFSFVTSNRWLGVRLEFVGTCIVALAATFAVTQRDSIDPGLAGLSISYALQITGVLNWLVRMSTEAENELVAVERIQQYIDVEVEAPADIPDNRPPANWPARGGVEFINYKMRYREGLDLVLKGVNVNIQGGEKVGIVGRTGAGKSSLILALFRMVEAAEGSIIIDDYDISRIGLNDLRRAIDIIPQDPVLFTGTVRSNLDPFGVHTEQDLWTALDRARLRDVIEAMGDLGLDGEVSEGGENFSQGQRQMIALARTLLGSGKILILDEATASVDSESDQRIQETIRQEFGDRTVLTIAHRIGTILDSDKIMVMDAGHVVEYDTPDNLLDDRNSVFYSMVKESNNM